MAWLVVTERDGKEAIIQTEHLAAVLPITPAGKDEPRGCVLSLANGETLQVVHTLDEMKVMLGAGVKNALGEVDVKVAPKPKNQTGIGL